MNSRENEKNLNTNEENKVEITETKARPKYAKWLVLAALALLVILYFVWPRYKNFIDEAIHYLTLGIENIDELRNWILQYKEWAIAISFFLMILQSIVAPIPAFLITLSNAAIFGWWQGAILSWVSSMAGAALCFYIARVLGRDVVEKFTGEGVLAKLENYFTDYGAKTIVVARLLPFVPFDPISYLAGLTPMGFGEFFLATGIGQLPATIIYSYIAGRMTDVEGGSIKPFIIGLSLIFAGAIVASILKSIFEKKHLGKVEASEKEEI